MMKGILILVWIGQLTSVVLAALTLVSGFQSASGAPQQAVVAALACAVAILPYCFARGLTEIVNAASAEEPKIAQNPEPARDPTRSTLGLG